MTSRAYTADFNEVKRLGRVDSAERTPEQTETARFWTEQAMVFFNRNLRNLALDHGLDTVETARMLAMVHVSAADSLVGCWEAKFHYLFWRPHGDPAGGHRRESRHDSGHDLDASVPRQPSRVPVRPRLLHVGGDPRAHGTSAPTGFRGR